MARDRDILLQLCRCLRGDGPLDMGGETDWDGLLHLANRTLVTPALAARLGDVSGTPGEVAAFLSTIRDRTAMRNARMHAQLVEAARALNRADVTPILLKGAALLTMRGPACDDRLLTDLDLMVPWDRRGPALAALEAIGYRPYAPGDETQGVNLSRDTEPGGLDLHYRLKFAVPGFDLAGMLRSSSEYPLGTGLALMPSPARLVGLFVLHDQLQEGDYWRGRIDLRHLVDLARIDRDSGGIDGRELREMFPPGFMRRALLTQLDTLAALLGASIPTEPGGRRVALQARRRRLQLRHPHLQPLLTLASLAADPTIAALPGARGGGPRALARGLRRMLVVGSDVKV